MSLVKEPFKFREKAIRKFGGKEYLLMRTEATMAAAKKTQAQLRRDGTSSEIVKDEKSGLILIYIPR